MKELTFLLDILMSDFDFYQLLTTYGNFYPTRHRVEKTEDFVEWTEQNFEYVRYNPRKDVKRYGLSLTSLDGGTSGIPDLDSLFEYNKENNTDYKERDFATFTPVHDWGNLNEIIAPIKNLIHRSHVLKLDPGGFFPPHRDHRGRNIGSFRLIVPLQNMRPPALNFVIDNKILEWETGLLYFLNTNLEHYLFNASFSPSYMIIYNVGLTEGSVDFVTRNFLYP